MAPWTAFPRLGEFTYTAATVQKHWGRLHRGDAEPLPANSAVLDAWVLFHNGEFQRAAEAGLAAGGEGIAVANKATCIYANYLERAEKNKLDLFMQAAERADLHTRTHPDCVNAWYWKAYAIGRYSQGVSVAKALAQGLGSQVKDALEKAAALEPRHADARIALGTFHAEVIDKVGPLIGGMTHGAKKDIGLQMFRDGLAIHPHSAIGLIEYANGLIMLEGDRSMADATQLYEQAARSTPMDAMEWLDIELARAELSD